jgi:hypothetical protein
MTRTLFLFVLASAGFVFAAACSSTPAVPGNADAALDVANADVADLDAGFDGGRPYPLNQVCSPVNLLGDAGDAGNLDLACDECSQSNCCDTLKLAKAAPDIGLFVQCSGAASCDAVCVEKCIIKYPVAAKAALTQRACRSHLCIGTCTDPQTTCQRCVEEKCLNESLAYDLDVAAYVLDVCASKCQNAACRDACVQQFPAGRNPYVRYTTCSLTRCAAECR